MRLRSAVIIPAFAVLWNAPAQNVSLFLKGVVLENTLDGKGIDQAEVSAEPRGNFRHTNPDGTFTLEFPRSQPGTLVRITVQKRDPATHEEYVVINDVQLKTFLPAIENTNDQKRTVVFVLCRKSEREEYARLFYKLKSKQAIEAEFNRRVAPRIAEKERLQRELQARAGRQEELEARIREQDDEIVRLKGERTDLENAAAAMSEQLAASRTAGDNSDRYDEAKRLILDGDVEGALRVLDHAAILREAAGGQAQLKQATDEFLLRAAALMSQLRFDEAETEYLAAMHAAPLSFDAHYWYGQMERVLHRQDKAIELFEKSRKIADLTSDNRGSALALTAQGNTYAEKKEFKHAADAHKGAVDEYEALVKKEPAPYSPLLAGALINEGVAERHLNDVDEADRLFNRALRIAKESLDPKSLKTHEILAAVNLNLGNLRRDQDRPQETYSFYQSGVSAFKELVAVDRSEYEPGLAQAENNLGMFADEASVRVADPATRRLLYAEARQSLESACKIREALAAQIPEIYEPDYAETLTNLGRLYGARQQFAEAKQSLQKAVSIRQALVKRSPDAYRAQYANSLSLLGRCFVAEYGSAGDPQLLVQAASTFETAVEVFAIGAEKDPEGFAVLLGGALTSLADVYTTQARWDDARQKFNSALRPYDKADNGMTSYPRFHTWSRMGYFYLKQGHTAEAIKAFEEAQSYFDRFSPRDKQFYRREVLDTAGTLAALKATRK